MSTNLFAFFWSSEGWLPQPEVGVFCAQARDRFLPQPESRCPFRGPFCEGPTVSFVRRSSSIPSALTLRSAFIRKTAR